MTESGRDPRREQRRAGDATAGDFVLGSDGKPLTDRYGRPIRRRSTSPRREAQAGPTPRAARPEHTRLDYSPPQRSNIPPQRSNIPPRRTPPLQQPPRQQPPLQQPPLQQPPRQVPAAESQPRYPSQFRAAERRRPPEVPRSYREPETRRPHSRRKKTPPLQRFLGCAGWLLAILLVFTLVFTLWTDSRLTRTDAKPEEQVANTAGTNWLLVGSDSRQGLSEEEQSELGTGGDVGVGRTDTIMLLHIPNKGKARLVSIPRDSYVEIPGFGMDKINASFTYGGPQLLTQTVENTTGLRIDHYAEIGMGGLANVVDSVGGVDVCVKEPINDPLAGIDLQPGCQELAGSDALGYVRTRATAMGDLDRVERQREFFASLLDRVTAPATLLNPFRAISLINHTASSFIVGKGDHVWHLARVALAMGTGVETETVPLGGFQDTAVGSVVLWDEAATQQLWDSMK